MQKREKKKLVVGRRGKTGGGTTARSKGCLGGRATFGPPTRAPSLGALRPSPPAKLTFVSLLLLDHHPGKTGRGVKMVDSRTRADTRGEKNAAKKKSGKGGGGGKGGSKGGKGGGGAKAEGRKGARQSKGKQYNRKGRK